MFGFSGRVLASFMVFGALIAIVVWANGSSMPPVAESSESQRFNMARAGAFELNVGTVSDWRDADDEAKLVYAMGSANALIARGADDDRASLTRRFLSCMERSVSRALPDYLLSDISYACAQALQY